MKAALGLGLPIVGGGGWSPDDLGDALLGWWDAERADLITQSGGAVSAWNDNVAGYSAIQAVTGAKPVWDANSFGGVRNLAIRSTEFDSGSWSKGQVTVTPNVAARPSGDVTADKIVEVATASYPHAVSQSVGNIVIGQVYTISVRAKAAERTAIFLQALSTNAKAHFDLSAGTVLSTGAGLTSGIVPEGAGWYRCWISFTADATSVGVFVGVSVGGSHNYVGDGVSGVFCTDAQLNTGALERFVLTTSTMAWDFGRPGVAFDGADDELTLASVPFPSGGDPCEVWALVDQTALTTDTTSRYLFSYGSGNANNTRRFLRNVSGNSKAQVTIGDGAGSGTSLSAGAAGEFLGKAVVRFVVDGANIRVDLNGVVGTPGPLVPNTAGGRTRLGALATTSAIAFWQGIVAAILVTGSLSADQAASLTAYLKTRGGVA